MTDNESLDKTAMLLGKAASLNTLRIVKAVAERPGVTSDGIARAIGAALNFVSARMFPIVDNGLVTRTEVRKQAGDCLYNYSITGVGLAVLAVVEAVRRAEEGKAEEEKGAA